jgi:uncharacterized membrane protein YcaP (DUF421 family)
MNVISTLVRTAVLYFFVIFAIRLMGKRQIGDMQPNELVITLLISEIAAIPLQDVNQPTLNGIAAVSMLVVLEIIVSVLALKFLPFRKLLSGNSVILIKDGVIDQKALKQVRLTIIDLIELLRSQGIFDPSEVAFAILEVNGGLSVVQKANYRSLQIRDVSNIDPKRETLPLPVISDGNIITDSLNFLGISEEQFKAELDNDVEKIFLMTLDASGNKTVILKE